MIQKLAIAMAPWFMTKTAFDVLKWAPFIMAAGYLGKYFERREDLQMSDFHNKSALFGGKNLAPGERVW